MSTGFYLIIVLIVAFLAFAIGFRKGFTRQLASLLGFAFGVVAARVLTPALAHSFHWATFWTDEPELQHFASNLICAVVIYMGVYGLFAICSPILKGAMSVFEIGMFNRLAGAFFALVKYLLWLSIIFNLVLCFSADRSLLRYERSDDGNLVAAVMALTPALLGCYGARDLAHFNQLKEAKTISCNFNPCYDVIFVENNTRCYIYTNSKPESTAKKYSRV